MQVTAGKKPAALRSFRRPALWSLLLAAALTGCRHESSEPEPTGLNALVQIGGGMERNGEGELEFVNLSYCPLTNDQLACLAEHPSLRKLWLYETPISDAALNHLSKLANLEVLVLGETKVSNFGLKRLSELKNLKELYLYGSQCTEEGVNELQALLPDVMIMY